MAKGQDAKKTAKKEPLKTAKEKKEEKREKKMLLKEIKKKCSVSNSYNVQNLKSAQLFSYQKTEH